MSLAVTAIKAAHRALAADVKRQARDLRRGAARAINRTAVTTRKHASQRIRETLNVKASKVKDRLNIVRANSSHLTGAVQSKRKPLRVSDFNGVRQTHKGVTVRMRKDKPRKLFKGAFMATMKSGHRGAYIRKPGGTRYSRGRPYTSSPNLPILELLGPNDQTIFGENLDDLVRLSDDLLQERLQREIDWALRINSRRAAG